MSILITGGAGYIATHTLVELSNANHDQEGKREVARDVLHYNLDELKGMVSAIRKIELALGSSIKRPSKSETPNIREDNLI